MKNLSPAVVCLILLMALMGSGPAIAQDLRLVFVGPAETSSWKGARQGLEEANILGRFTGQTYALDRATAGGVKASAQSERPLAVLAAAEAETLMQLSEALPGVAVLNLTAEDDALRRDCRPNLLHIIPSARMRADAVAQWRKKSQSADVQALAWHSEFVKFAARELNNRFSKAQGVRMDDHAWAGWAAVKMISEAVARTRQTDPQSLLVYLKEEMEFDGQKGVPHTFRDTGQLRQPLLIVEEGKLVAEAPVRGVADPDDLDTLGLPSCK